MTTRALAFCTFAALTGTTGGVLSEEVGDTVVVSTERLNLRGGPGTSNPVVRELPEGTRLRITARDEGWARVTL